jgi:hypothetical protein
METAPAVLVRSSPKDRNSARVLQTFVTPERVAAARIGRARAKDPATADEIEALQSLAGVYRADVNTEQLQATDFPLAGADEGCTSHCSPTYAAS